MTPSCAWHVVSSRGLLAAHVQGILSDQLSTATQGAVTPLTCPRRKGNPAAHLHAWLMCYSIIAAAQALQGSLERAVEWALMHRSPVVHLGHACRKS